MLDFHHSNLRFHNSAIIKWSTDKQTKEHQQLRRSPNQKTQSTSNIDLRLIVRPRVVGVLSPDSLLSY